MNRNLLNFCVLVALSVMGMPNVGHARPLLGTTKSNLDAGTGKCLPKSNKSVLNKLGIKGYEADNGGNVFSKSNPPYSKNPRELNSSDGRFQSLANVVGAISTASNGKLDKFLKNTKIYYGRRWTDGISRQATYGIQLNKGKANVQGVGGKSQYGGTENAALIAHELAHKIGADYYRKFERTNGAKCAVSKRGHKHLGRKHQPNEVFADIFAAYVTDPSLFQNRGKACADAFDFFKNVLFEEKGNLQKTCASRKGSFRGGSGGSSSFGKGSSGQGGLFSSILEKLKNRSKKVKEARKKRVQTEAERNRNLIRSAGGALDSSDSPR